MDWAVDVLFNKEIIDGFDVLIFSSICGSNDSTNTNGILIHQFDGLCGINNVAIFCAEDVALLNFEVASCFFPAHLHSRIHNNVGLRIVLASSLTLILPALLHGKCTQHLSQNSVIANNRTDLEIHTIASEDPTVLVPIALSSSVWVGALNILAIIETQRFWISAVCGYSS